MKKTSYLRYTGEKRLLSNIEMAPMVYSGAQGKLIHGKKPEVENLVSDSL
jgi:hypothetical protein